jgi:1,4-alpha-glucan branching enzyme
MVETELGPEHVIATFRLDVKLDVERASVVGEFNDWSVTANPMVRNETGFETQIPLMPGRSYRYRYLLDGERWENDWTADAYVPNNYGSEDSVIDLRDVTVAGEQQGGPAPATSDAPVARRKRSSVGPSARRASR